MGITSENVAHRYGVTRHEQDQASVSHLLWLSGALVLELNAFIFMYDCL